MRMCMCGHPDIAHEHLGGRCEAGGTATRERILRCDCERFKEQKQAPPPTPPPPAPAAGLLARCRALIWERCHDPLRLFAQYGDKECADVEDRERWRGALRTLDDFAQLVQRSEPLLTETDVEAIFADSRCGIQVTPSNMFKLRQAARLLSELLGEQRP